MPMEKEKLFNRNKYKEVGRMKSCYFNNIRWTRF